MEWRKVVGWENLYEVSDTGLVRSVDRSVFKRNGVMQTFKGKQLRSHLSSTGYPVVRLSDDSNDRRRMARCHILVAMAFIPNPLNKPEVNHIDGDKTNSNFENLEWVTSQENRKHAWDTGLRNRSHLPNYFGEDNWNSKLTDDDIAEMRKDRESGMTFQSIADKFNVHKSTALSAIKGKTWKHTLPKPPSEVQDG